MTVPTLATPDRARAGDLARRFSSARVLVVGDVMLDQFLIGRVSRISPEAPVPIVPVRARGEPHRGRRQRRAQHRRARRGGWIWSASSGATTAAGNPRAGARRAGDPHRGARRRSLASHHDEGARRPRIGISRWRAWITSADDEASARRRSGRSVERGEIHSRDPAQAAIVGSRTISKGTGNATAGRVTGRHSRTSTGIPVLAQSEDPPPRLTTATPLFRHPEQPRGGGGDTSADSNERRREPGGGRVLSRASRVQRGIDHAR